MIMTYSANFQIAWDSWIYIQKEFVCCREYGRVSMGKEWIKRAQQTFLRQQNQQNHVWDPGHIRYWWRLNYLRRKFEWRLIADMISYSVLPVTGFFRGDGWR